MRTVVGAPRITRIAASGETFADFQPYVAGLEAAGRVVFTATLRDGRSGVFAGDGTAACKPLLVAPRGAIDAMSSHPALNRRSDMTVYVATAGGGTAVVLLRDGVLHTLAARDERFAEIGPLGPTMNEAGVVAFRATTRDGLAGVYAGTPDGVVTIAEARGDVCEFHGLPVIDAHGVVAAHATVRAEDGTLREAVLRGRGGAAERVVMTAGRLQTLSPFVSVDDGDGVGFGAVTDEGHPGAFIARRGKLLTLAPPDGRFATLRSVLLTRPGRFVAVGTAPGGDISVFAGPDPVADRVLGIGDAFGGSRIAALAVNPVSVNRDGAIAIRVLLEDERQLILRAV